MAETDQRTYTLRSIYLRKSSTSIAKSFDPNVHKPQVAVLRKMECVAECNEIRMNQDEPERVIKSCVFAIQFEFAYTAAQDQNGGLQTDDEIEKAQVAKISAEFAADYLYNGKDFPTDQELQQWGSTSALTHLWPYWREFCHSSLLRMNLPVTMVPMLLRQNKLSEG